MHKKGALEYILNLRDQALLLSHDTHLIQDEQSHVIRKHVLRGYSNYLNDRERYRRFKSEFGWPKWVPHEERSKFIQFCLKNGDLEASQLKKHLDELFTSLKHFFPFIKERAYNGGELWTMLLYQSKL